jgi:putative hemolysin
MTWTSYLAGHVPELLLMALLLCLSAFFNGSEAALFSLSPGQAYKMARQKGAGQKAAWLMARPERILQALLLGNLLVTIAFFGVSSVLLHGLTSAAQAPPYVAGLLWLVPPVLIVLFGDVTPKLAALNVAERWALLAAGPLVLLRRLLSPPVRVINRGIVNPLTRLLAPRPAADANITGEELASLLDLTAQRGILDHQANALLQEILSLTDLRVADVMVPRVDVICYDVDSPPAGLVQIVKRTHLRRVPVYERDPGAMLGVVHAKRLLMQPGTPLRQLVVKVPFVPESANLERALVQLRVRRAQIAIAVDEYGGTAGIITLEDILEQIVGDLPDEHDSQEGSPVEHKGPGWYVLDGDLPVHEWAEAAGMDLGGPKVSTIGGFVTSRLGRIAAVGDEARYRNLRFKVLSMRRRRVGKLEIRLLEGEE